VEYRLAEWIAQHPPEGRVFASGGLRFRLNSWFDIPQVGGGFETGLQNRFPVAHEPSDLLLGRCSLRFNNDGTFTTETDGEAGRI